MEGRVCDDIADGGRLGSFRGRPDGRPVAVRTVVAAQSGWYSSPSSEAISVMRDDMILGARCESAMWSGVGKELFVGDRGRVEVAIIVEKW